MQHVIDIPLRDAVVAAVLGDALDNGNEDPSGVVEDLVDGDLASVQSRCTISVNLPPTSTPMVSILHRPVCCRFRY